MLRGILAIAGQPGLFKLVSEGKNTIIVESLLTGKRMPANSTARISSLGEIAIFTESGEEELNVLLKKIEKAKNGEKLPKMTNDEMKAIFAEVLPDYDKERVYVSDMKKVLQWYNLLLENELLNYEIKEKKEGEEEAAKDEEEKEKVAE